MGLGCSGRCPEAFWEEALLLRGPRPPAPAGRASQAGRSAAAHPEGAPRSQAAPRGTDAQGVEARPHVLRGVCNGPARAGSCGRSGRTRAGRAHPSSATRSAECPRVAATHAPGLGSGRPEGGLRSSAPGRQGEAHSGQPSAATGSEGGSEPGREPGPAGTDEDGGGAAGLDQTPGRAGQAAVVQLLCECPRARRRRASRGPGEPQEGARVSSRGCVKEASGQPQARPEPPGSPRRPAPAATALGARRRSGTEGTRRGHGGGRQGRAEGRPAHRSHVAPAQAARLSSPPAGAP